MPRIRSVHPSICDDENLARASALAERTFIRLWTHLDDAGRCEDRPKLLAAKLYPEHDSMDAEAVDRDLNELKSNNLVIRYRIAGVAYLCAKPETWGKYQKPRHPQPSKFPEPPKAKRKATAKRRKTSAQRSEVPRSSGEDGVGVGVNDGVGEGVLAAEAASGNGTANDRDPIWDALVAAFGSAPETKTERQGWNKCAKELREVSATPQQIQSRVGEFKARYQGAACTPFALVKHWGSLSTQPSRYSGPHFGPPAQDRDPSCEHSDPMCEDCRRENKKRIAELARKAVESLAAD